MPSRSWAAWPSRWCCATGRGARGAAAKAASTCPPRSGRASSPASAPIRGAWHRVRYAGAWVTALLEESVERQRALLADGLRHLIREYGEKESFRDLQVVELSFYAGRRNKDIAAQLAMEEKHVAGVKFRAIARLRELIQAANAGRDAVSVGELADEAGVADVWREWRLSCLKRSTLGAYLLGVLEEPRRGYTRFHLEVIGCPICRANVADLDAESQSDEHRTTRRDRLFVSSVGFLRTARPG